MPKGLLQGAHVWDGEVAVEGDIVIEPGASLTVRPGTRIHFAERAKWSSAVFRRAAEGHPIETSSRELCDMVVRGSLRVEGNARAPVVFGDEEIQWGGIVVLESGTIHLSSTVARRTPQALLQLFDDAEARLQDCTLGDSMVGVWSWGSSRLSLAGGRLFGLAFGVMAQQRSSLKLSNVRVQGCKTAVAANEQALVTVEDCEFINTKGSVADVHDNAWVKISRCSGCDAHRLVAEAGARLERIDD